MRTQEGFPNFGEVDDIANFEQIQRGLMAVEDEWVYMNRGFGIPGRVTTHEDGSITAPATDEAFMREHFKEWKRLMKAARTSPSSGSHDVNAPAPLDPSRSSYYVSDALYRELIANFSDWQDDARAVTDSPSATNSAGCSNAKPGCSISSATTSGSLCTRRSASIGCRRRRMAATRAARSRSCSRSASA